MEYYNLGWFEGLKDKKMRQMILMEELILTSGSLERKFLLAYTVLERLVIQFGLKILI